MFNCSFFKVCIVNLIIFHRQTFLCLMIYVFILSYLFNPKENYMNVPRNKVLGGSNEKHYMTRQMQTRTKSNAINSEDNFRVSEDRLARIANWHHLPRYNSLLKAFLISKQFGIKKTNISKSKYVITYQQGNDGPSQIDAKCK